MHRLVRERVPGAGLFQVAVELGWLIAAIIVAGVLAASWVPSWKTFVSVLSFAILLLCFNSAFGFYRRSQRVALHEYLIQAALLLVVEFPIAYVGAKIVLSGSLFHEDVGFAVFYALCCLTLLRVIVAWPVARALVPRRVLVLGTGREASSVEASIAAAESATVDLIGFFALDPRREITVSRDRIVAAGSSFEEAIERLNVNEIIVAVGDQRGGILPMQALLDCRLRGVKITDLARFFERVHGRVPVDSLKASWLIFGRGFRQHRGRRIVKRGFDLVVVTGLLISVLPIMAIAAIGILVTSGRPVIYRQERVGCGGRKFTLLKFRSMHVDAERDGACWAAANDTRTTAFGRLMRKTRIDELPQLVNVLRGEMSLVGPRPERPGFVTTLIEKIPFYAIRHSVPPGITGWAQVRYSYGGSIEDTVRKLEYDIYYVKNHSLLLDLVILFKTVRVVLLGEGAR